MLDKKVFANRMRATRQARHLTQVYLAHRLHFDKSYISHCEAGRTFPPLTFISNIADIFQVPIAFLIGESDDSIGASK